MVFKLNLYIAGGVPNNNMMVESDATRLYNQNIVLNKQLTYFAITKYLSVTEL